MTHGDVCAAIGIFFSGGAIETVLSGTPNSPDSNFLLYVMLIWTSTLVSLFITAIKRHKRNTGRGQPDIK